MKLYQTEKKKDARMVRLLVTEWTKTTEPLLKKLKEQKRDIKLVSSDGRG